MAIAYQDGGSSAYSSLLKIGSRGTDVRRLQEQLNSLGFNAGKADGIFGKNTASALKAFQKAAGLTADGIFGSKSSSALSTYKTPTAPAPTPSKPMTAPPTTTAAPKPVTAPKPTATVAPKPVPTPTTGTTKTTTTTTGTTGSTTTTPAAVNPVVQNPVQAATPAAASWSGMSQDEYREKLMASARAGIMSEYDANIAIIKNNLATALSNFKAEQAALQPIYQRNMENIAQNQFTSEEATKEMMNRGGWTGANSGLAIGEQIKIANAADKNRADAGTALAQDEADIARRQTLAQQTYGNDLQAQELYKNNRLAGAEADALIQSDERNRGIYESDRNYTWDQEQSRIAQEQANRAYEWQREQAAQNQARWEAEFNRGILESDRNYALQQAAAARAKASGGGGGGSGTSGNYANQYSEDEFMAWVRKTLDSTSHPSSFTTLYDSMMNDPNMSTSQKAAIKKEYSKRYEADSKSRKAMEARQKASQTRYQF